LAFPPDALATLGGTIALIEGLVLGDTDGGGASPVGTSTVSFATRVLAQ